MADVAETVGQVVEYSAAAYQAKHDKPVECLLKNHEGLLAFFSYPDEHWLYLRTTNPVESVFPTARLRTVKMHGGLSRKPALAMVLLWVPSAQ